MTTRVLFALAFCVTAGLLAAPVASRGKQCRLLGHDRRPGNRDECRRQRDGTGRRPLHVELRQHQRKCAGRPQRDAHRLGLQRALDDRRQHRREPLQLGSAQRQRHGGRKRQHQVVQRHDAERLSGTGRRHQGQLRVPIQRRTVRRLARQRRRQRPDPFERSRPAPPTSASSSVDGNLDCAGNSPAPTHSRGPELGARTGARPVRRLLHHDDVDRDAGHAASVRGSRDAARRRLPGAQHRDPLGGRHAGRRRPAAALHRHRHRQSAHQPGRQLRIPGSASRSSYRWPSNWNGRFMFQGGGGTEGSTPDRDRDHKPEQHVSAS